MCEIETNGGGSTIGQDQRGAQGQNIHVRPIRKRAHCQCNQTRPHAKHCVCFILRILAHNHVHADTHPKSPLLKVNKRNRRMQSAANAEYQKQKAKKKARRKRKQKRKTKWMARRKNKQMVEGEGQKEQTRKKRNRKNRTISSIWVLCNHRSKTQ